LNHDPPVSASEAVGIIDVYYHVQPSKISLKIILAAKNKKVDYHLQSDFPNFP
jgi:hypothetical protein